MGKETKTNACRILDRAKISYEEREYPVDENDLSGVRSFPEIKRWKCFHLRIY